ncbi:hypothetical protein [Primorskyibacter flagellatus]|uniref:hypothetical protein n=1 Tax=Primorskyibacter flagellatus TaxID=1387277 RepID=UPI003A95DAD7
MTRFELIVLDHRMQTRPAIGACLFHWNQHSIKMPPIKAGTRAGHAEFNQINALSDKNLIKLPQNLTGQAESA